MNENAPPDFRGLDRYAARKKVIADLEALGLIDQIENITHAVPHGDRSGVVIEPWLSEQWYCDAPKLAGEALKAVEDGRTKFVPAQWTNTYYAWMRDLQPWCISRQLWWGHQIPAWYGEDGKYFVAENESEALAEAEKHYGKPVTLKRDEDVFDTWFSSALWPFSTLGWPDQTPELARYYPTDVLVTGFDIIFFWVARMMMMGMHFMKDVPFKTVYIHALVRDEKGQKMSKSKGNVIDPLDIIDKFGCDALRFTLATMSTPGRDIRLATQRIEGNRNFATKLWNAARFCEMNNCVWKKGFDAANVTQAVNKWIVGKVHQASEDVAVHLDVFRFDLASARAYEFAWGEFCDWYLEFAKPILTGTDEEIKAETRATASWALGELLHILHPFMPFITEEIWEHIAPQQPMLIGSSWLKPVVGGRGHAGIEWVKGLIESIRAVRNELGIPAKAKLNLLVLNIGKISKYWLTENIGLIERLANLSSGSLEYVDKFPKGSGQIIYSDAIIGFPLAEIIDLDQERARLKKEGEKLTAEIRKIEAKLGNKDFVDRAPPEVVEEQRERKAEAEATLVKLAAAEKSLAG
jgi:valyl-tRNA synthetase